MHAPAADTSEDAPMHRAVHFPKTCVVAGETPSRVSLSRDAAGDRPRRRVDGCHADNEENRRRDQPGDREAVLEAATERVRNLVPLPRTVLFSDLHGGNALLLLPISDGDGEQDRHREGDAPNQRLGEQAPLPGHHSGVVFGSFDEIRAKHKSGQLMPRVEFAVGVAKPNASI